MEKQIGKYWLLEQVGVGQSGTVYKAKDLEIQRTVALKVLKVEYFSGNAVAGERFQREVQAIGRLQHPNIVAVFDTQVTSRGIPYLAMQFIDGEGLDTLLRSEQGLPPERVLKIIQQLGNALDYAHSQGVIHRDIKPSNILIDKSDHVFVVDFSTAIVADTTLTPMGQVIGTPQYMAPEVIRGERATHLADLYSLGILTYLMFTGKKPFREGGIAATFSSIVNDSPFSFREIGCKLPVSLERVLKRSLSKEPDSRFQSAKGFVEAISDALERGGMFDSQVEEIIRERPSSLGSSGIYKAPKAARRKINYRSRIIWGCSLLCASAVIGGMVVGAAYIHTNPLSKLSLQTRSLTGIGFSEERLAKFGSEDLLTAFTVSMPKKTAFAVLKEILKRDNPVVVQLLTTLLKHPDPAVKLESLKVVIMSHSLKSKEKIELMTIALHDSDRFLRLVAALELLDFDKREGHDLLVKRRAIESDGMVARMFDRLIQAK